MLLMDGFEALTVFVTVVYVVNPTRCEKRAVNSWTVLIFDDLLDRAHRRLESEHHAGLNRLFDLVNILGSLRMIDAWKRRPGCLVKLLNPISKS